MKLTTNIVLKGNHGRTQSYMVQLTPKTSYVGDFIFDRYAGPSSDHADIYGKYSSYHLTKDGNDWYENREEGIEYQLHKANVRLYFPQYSVDTFDKGSTYILSLSTYIHGVEVRLGDFKVKRRDALACAPVRFDGMDEYYEYMDFEIADPYSIHYASEGAAIRTALGGATNDIDNCSILYVCLSPVEEAEEGYILRNDWGSGQNSLLLSDSQDLSLSINYDPVTNSIHMVIHYSGQEEMSLPEYIREKFGTEYTAVLWEYVVMDDDNVYYTAEQFDYIVMSSYDNSFDYSFSVSDHAPGENELSLTDLFKSWDDWKEGLYIRGSVSFISEFDNGESYIPYMTVMSNRLPITEELFSMLIRGEGIPTKIDLNSLDMNNVNLTAINKINKIVNNPVTPTDSTKSHLIQPVFYQTRELTKVVVHPSVTENIALNLDPYKSQVERFKLQIEGIVFNEIGRTGKGIIFKVYGNMLPKAADEGVMYILDQNNDLVTTGKYSYIY